MAELFEDWCTADGGTDLSGVVTLTPIAQQAAGTLTLATVPQPIAVTAGAFTAEVTPGEYLVDVELRAGDDEVRISTDTATQRIVVADLETPQRLRELIDLGVVGVSPLAKLNALVSSWLDGNVNTEVSQTLITEALTDPESEPRQVLDASYAPLWRAGAVYAAGDLVLLPAPINGPGTRNTAGTARSSFDATEQGRWTAAAAPASIVATVATKASVSDVAAFATPRRLARPNLTLLDLPANWVSTGAKVSSFSATYAKRGPFGSTCARIVSTAAASGSGAQFRRQSVNWDFTGKQFVIWLYAPDLAHWPTMRIMLGDATLANYFQFEPTGASNFSEQKYMRAGQWVAITVPWAPTQITGTPDRAAITQARISVVDDASGVPIEAFFGGIATMPEQSVYPNGVISLTFDDSYNMDHMVEKLGQYSMPATVFAVGSQVGLDASRPTVEDYRMLTDTLGWEIAAHAASVADHSNYPSLSDADKITKMTTVRQWHADNGFPTDLFAWPSGNADAASDAIARRFWTAARGTGTTLESLPIGRREYIRAFSSQASNATSTAMNAYADRVKASKSWGVVVFHAVYDGAGADPSEGLGTTWANFDAFIDYIAAQGIAVETMGRVLQRF